MFKRFKISLTTIASAFLLIAVALPSFGAWTVVDARWRPDKNNFNTGKQLWDYQSWYEGWGEAEQFYPKYFKPAGSVHVILRNDTKETQTITLASVDGKPINDILTTPKKAGPVIWYRMNAPQLPTQRTGGREDIKPLSLPAGQWMECGIRLRYIPTVPVKLKFKIGNEEQEVSVDAAQPVNRLESVSFSPKIDHVYCYVRSYDKKTRTGKVMIDGKDFTRKCRWVEGSKDSGISVADIQLDTPFAYGSHHLIEIDLRDGSKLAEPVMAWDNFFSIGMVGGTERDLVKKAKEKHFNTYYWSDPTEPFSMGMNQIPSANWGQFRPRTLDQCGVLFNYNWDEPDAHDWNRKDVPCMDRLGILAEEIVQPIINICRKNAPTTPTLVLADGTYKPLDLYVYGQLPDVFATDPYIPLGSDQLDYVRYDLGIARDASAPKPLIGMLWVVGFEYKEDYNGAKDKFRAPSPEEERIMAFYALGAGCKGIAYFCDFAHDMNMIEKNEGREIHLSMNQPLYDEVGRINADIKALAPYLSIGCPMVERDQGNVYVSELLCGPDSMAVIAVNKDHYIGYTTYNQYAWHNPTENVKLNINLPKGFKDCIVKEVKDGKLVSFPSEVRNGSVRLNVGTVDTSRAFVITRTGK